MSDLDRATEIVVEYLARRPGIRSRLDSQTNSGMKAQSLEQTCNVMSNPDRGDEEAAGPRVSDVTGEAAIRTDYARRLLAELDHAEGELLLGANRLIGHPLASFATLAEVVVKHGYLMAGTVKGAARVFDRAIGETLGRRKPKAGLSHDGRPGCESCGRLVVDRVPWWSEPNYRDGKPTDLGGLLAKKVRLCRACKTFVVEQEPSRLPTVAELRHRHDHPRGHWPRRHVVAGR